MLFRETQPCIKTNAPSDAVTFLVKRFHCNPKVTSSLLVTGPKRGEEKKTKSYCRCQRTSLKVSFQEPMHNSEHILRDGNSFCVLVKKNTKLSHTSQALGGGGLPWAWVCMIDTSFPKSRLLCNNMQSQQHTGVTYHTGARMHEHKHSEFLFWRGSLMCDLSSLRH